MKLFLCTIRDELNWNNPKFEIDMDAETKEEAVDKLMEHLNLPKSCKDYISQNTKEEL